MLKNKQNPGMVSLKNHNRDSFRQEIKQRLILPVLPTLPYRAGRLRILPACRF